MTKQSYQGLLEQKWTKLENHVFTLEMLRVWLPHLVLQNGIQYFPWRCWTFYQKSFPLVLTQLLSRTVNSFNFTDEHLRTIPVTEYSCRPLPQQNVHVEDDPEFLISCDCSDSCANRKKCACIQLTIQVNIICANIFLFGGGPHFFFEGGSQLFLGGWGWKGQKSIKDLIYFTSIGG